MKKPKRYFMLIIIAIVISIPLIGYLSNLNHTFKELVTDRIPANENIELITLIRSSSEKEVEIKDPAQIKQIMDNLSTTKLVTTSSPDLKNTYSYYIYIKVGHKQHSRTRYGLTLYSNHYISIYDIDCKDKYNAQTYKIKSPYSMQMIDDLYTKQ